MNNMIYEVAHQADTNSWPEHMSRASAKFSDYYHLACRLQRARKRGCVRIFALFPIIRSTTCPNSIVHGNAYNCCRASNLLSMNYVATKLFYCIEFISHQKNKGGFLTRPNHSNFAILKTSELTHRRFSSKNSCRSKLLFDTNQLIILCDSI